MKRRITWLTLLIFSFSFLCNAAPRANYSVGSNYGTKICEELVKRANTLYNKGKYAEAKVLYEEALATGDKFFARKCSDQLRSIITLLKGRKQPAQNVSKPVFTVSQDTVILNYLGGDYPIHVSGDKWTASVTGNDWCKISVDRKRGLVKIYSAPNDSTATRTAVITIRNGNGSRRNVEVINEGSPEILRSSAQSLMFTPSGETSVVNIDSNTDWHLADVPAWLRAVKGNDDIQFTAAANDESKDRVAQVKVESASNQQIIINIIQGAALNSLAFSKNNLQFGPEGGDEYIHVLTDADDWRFGDFPHWCQLERVNDNTIRVHCTPNEPVDMPREASVNVTTGNQTLGINVFQDPKPIVHLIPVDGIGGRRISFGFAAGYVHPFIEAKSSSPYTFSAVNYAIGNQNEQASYSSSGGFTVAAYTDIRVYKNLYLNAGIDFLYYKYKNDINANMTITLPQGSAQYYSKGPALCSFQEKYTNMTLEIPVLVSYRVPVTKTGHFQFNLGPVVSIGLSSNLDFSGKCNSTQIRNYKIVNGIKTTELYDNSVWASHLNYDGSFNLYSRHAEYRLMTSDGGNAPKNNPQDFGSAPFSRFNFGLRFGAGYEYMGISLNLSYQFMLTNSANKKYWDGDRWTVFNSATNLMTGYSQRNNMLVVTLGYTFRY